MSTLDHKLEPEVTAVRRLEVITGTGRRRRFTEDFKARVVEETLVSGTRRLGSCAPAWSYAAAGLHMAPPGAPAAGETESKAPQFRAGHCGDGGSIRGRCEDGSASGLARPAEAAEASRLRSMA